ncbi:MAG: transposase [Alphaproteobacteria bacterium]|nr:transposase [Alphaproteobacteria bacterium]
MFGIAIGHRGVGWRDVYIERYNRTVRHEWLGTNLFNSIEEGQDYTIKWLWTDNNDRPNTALPGA